MCYRTPSLACCLVLFAAVLCERPQAPAAPPLFPSDLKKMEGVWVSEIKTPVQGSFSLWARVWEKGDKHVIDLRIDSGAPGRTPFRLGNRSFPLVRDGRDLVIEGIDPKMTRFKYRLGWDSLEIEPAVDTLIPDGEELLVLPANETLKLKRARR